MARKSDWCVTARCVVTKVFYCDDCTEEQARRDPEGHSRYSELIDQIGLEVKSVAENK